MKGDLRASVLSVWSVRGIWPPGNPNRHMHTSLRQTTAPARSGALLRGAAQCDPLLEVVRVMESPHNGSHPEKCARSVS